jgi:hypothetical protein
VAGVRVLGWGVGFFPEEPAPPEQLEQPEREPDPPWLAAPVGEVPVALPVTALLASSEFTAVVLRSVRVYSNGMEFEVQGKLRKAGASGEEWADLQGRFSEYGRLGRRTSGRLRIGVQMADGSRALSAPGLPADDDEETGVGYRLTRTGGGGTGSDRFQDTDWSFWLWPLPPDGPLTLVIDWPAMGLPEQQFSFDGNCIGNASQQIATIWPDGDMDSSRPQPSWTISF